MLLAAAGLAGGGCAPPRLIATPQPMAGMRLYFEPKPKVTYTGTDQACMVPKSEDFAVWLQNGLQDQLTLAGFVIVPRAEEPHHLTVRLDVRTDGACAGCSSPPHAAEIHVVMENEGAVVAQAMIPAHQHHHPRLDTAFPIRVTNEMLSSPRLLAFARARPATAASAPAPVAAEAPAEAPAEAAPAAPAAESAAVQDLRTKCDKRRRAAACAKLAAMLEAGTEVALDLTAAAAHYAKACELRDLPSCTAHGEMTAEGRGVAKSVERAAEIFLKACKKGQGAACTGLGRLWDVGQDAESAKSACESFASACKAKDALGCFFLGVCHAEGRGGVAKDQARAEALYADALERLQKGCADKVGRTCHEFGVLHREGRGNMTANAESARKFFQRACTLGYAPACAEAKRLGAAP